MWRKHEHLRTDDVRKQHRTHRQEELGLNRRYRMADMASAIIQLNPVNLHTKTIDDRINLVDGAAEVEVEVTDKVVDSCRMECYHDSTTIGGMGEISGAELREQRSHEAAGMRRSSKRKRHSKRERFVVCKILEPWRTTFIGVLGCAFGWNGLPL
jgi:hypothetical protein